MRERQVVMITGASEGVGRATAVAFARRGARIGLLARGREGLEAARRDVEAAGGEAVTYRVDVARADQVDTAAASLEDVFGPIDVWVNNAMASVFSPVAETTPEEFERVTTVTYLGVVHGTLAALRRMRARTKEPLSRSVRRSRTGAFHCRPLTTLPNAPCRGSATRCEPSCCTTTAASD